MVNKKFKILIADDDKEIRSLLYEILSDEGYDVNTASDGLEAIELIQKKDFDIILTDLVMPNIDGLEVLKASRSKNENTLVIIITGFATMESTIEATKSGAYDYITKPFLIEEIRLLVQRASDFLFYKNRNRELEDNIKVIEKEKDLLKGEIDVLKSEVSRGRELSDLTTGSYEFNPLSSVKRMSDVSQAYLKNYYERKEKMVKELERLGNMWLNGEITDDEFKAEKQKILSSIS